MPRDLKLTFTLIYVIIKYKEKKVKGSGSMQDFKNAIQQSTTTTGMLLMAFLAGSEAEGAAYKTILAILIAFLIAQFLIIFAFIDVTKEDR